MIWEPQPPQKKSKVWFAQGRSTRRWGTRHVERVAHVFKDRRLAAAANSNKGVQVGRETYRGKATSYTARGAILPPVVRGIVREPRLPVADSVVGRRPVEVCKGQPGRTLRRLRSSSLRPGEAGKLSTRTPTREARLRLCFGEVHAPNQ